VLLKQSIRGLSSIGTKLVLHFFRLVLDAAAGPRTSGAKKNSW
jgi:hypothetical protein